MAIHAPSVVRVNAELSGGGHAVAAAVLGGTAGDGWGRAAAYDAYADGLHTYSLWYLHDHDAAADAVYCAFVAADRNHTNLQQPEQIQSWLYALLRHECRLREREADEAPKPVSQRLRPKADSLGESGVTASLLQLEGNLRRAEFQSLAWPEAEGLAPAHREVLELSIRHGLDSRGLALVLGLREGSASAGLASSHGFGLLADAWRELERSLAATAVAGSGRDNCAQLAELTFGWSGKLNATLREPLTEHVDRCSRCQHYLHTVIGTPSAPTILPFVAAPRALRDILLTELADADAAAAAGVDLDALGRRCGTFGPEGFPSRGEQPVPQGTSNPPAGAGRGPRRRQAGPSRTTRPQRATSSSTPRPQPVNKSAAAGNEADDGLFRAIGSWADKVLPPTPGTEVLGPAELWRPEPSPGYVRTASGRFATRPPRPAAPAPAPAPVRRPTAGSPRLPRYANPTSARGGPASMTPRPNGPGGKPAAATTAANAATATGNAARTTAATARTAAAFAPASVAAPAAATASIATTASAAASAATASTASASRFAAARSRHKARPMRQAVVSAMALGAIGAVAAAAAAMLGVGSHPNSNTAALDGSQGTENVGTSSTSSAAVPGNANHMTVSVTTASPGTHGFGAGLVPTANGGGTVGGSAAGASPTSAASGAFYVSVNQRDGDPNSVRILLRNTGSGPLNWYAAPSVSWLTLSQSSGTLAAGQSTTVTATATGSAPSGEWAAQILFSPGGIIVTLHGGVPAGSGGTTPTSGSGGTSGGGSTTPTGSTTSTGPTTSPTTGSPTPPPSTTPPSTPPPSTTATGSQPTATAGSTSETQGPAPSGTTTVSPSTKSS
jgi:DNA-directed RNA polymerase specialized sigma24 family protein